MFGALEEELELTRDHYQSTIPESMHWRNWAQDAEGMIGDVLLSFVNNEPFVVLKSLSGDAQRNPRGYVVRGVFEDAYNYMKSGHLLRQVINKLNAINYNHQAERHQFNDLYEKILKDLQSAGNAGEFHTPRAVSQFMVDMVTRKTWCHLCRAKTRRGVKRFGVGHRVGWVEMGAKRRAANRLIQRGISAQGEAHIGPQASLSDAPARLSATCLAALCSDSCVVEASAVERLR